MQAIGIQHLSLTKVILDELLPAMAARSTQNHPADAETAVAHLALIVGSGMSLAEEAGHPQVLETVHQHGRIKTQQKGTIVRLAAGTPVHLPPSLGSKVAKKTCSG